MTAEFSLSDAGGVIQLDLGDSLTKVLGKIVVSASTTIQIPEFQNERGWAIVRGLDWSPLSNAAICSADVIGSSIVIQVSMGTYEVLYGIY